MARELRLQSQRQRATAVDYYRGTHLVDRERVELALDYLVHEMGKITPSTPHATLRHDLSMKAPNQNSDDVQIRDFWNLTAAVAGGWRLKEIIKLITRENIKWSRRELELGRLIPSEQRMGWLKNAGPYSLAAAVAYLRDQEGRVEAARAETAKERAGRHPEDLFDPLIGILRGDGSVEVYDGNSRLKARVEAVAAREDDGAGERVNIWVGEQRGGMPNYWIPTAYMFFVRELLDKNSLRAFRDMVAHESTIALHELDTRVLA